MAASAILFCPNSSESRDSKNAATALTSEKVLLALERVLKSRIFIKSARLSRFLQFAVEHTLEGRGGELKEYTIATKVYERKDDFDPAVDTIVRSEARRLRRKLKEYYDSEGTQDNVVIAFLPGSYVTVHRMRSVSPEVANLPEESVSIAVEPFECDAANTLAWECAFGISDEILHYLTNCAGIRVVCRSPLRSRRDGNMPEATVLDPRPGVVIRGTVRADDHILRVTTRATSADRQLLWSHQVDSLVGGTTRIHLQETVANDVLIHISSWLRCPRPDTWGKTAPPQPHGVQAQSELSVLMS